jgi:hypothetical protein
MEMYFSFNNPAIAQAGAPDGTANFVSFNLEILWASWFN